MKKIRLLIATLVCVIMLMGVGYAWWTDSVTISGITETGIMDVYFKDASCEFSEYVDAAAACSEDGKEISVSLANLYPGATGTLSATIVNGGSIPVQVASVKLITEGGDEDLINHLLISEDNVNFVSLPEFIEEYDESVQGETIAVGMNKKPDTVYLKLSEDLDELEDASVNFTVKFDFEQFNRPLDDGILG